jgi:hypothetical protein
LDKANAVWEEATIGNSLSLDEQLPFGTVLKVGKIALHMASAFVSLSSQAYY